jgi:hypothetical protein
MSVSCSFVHRDLAKTGVLLEALGNIPHCHGLQAMTFASNLKPGRYLFATCDGSG